MKKIDHDLMCAIIKTSYFQRSNTLFDGNAVYLYGHKIAQIKDNYLILSNCGHATRTTANRLRAIIEAFGFYLNVRNSKADTYFEVDGRLFGKNNIKLLIG